MSPMSINEIVASQLLDFSQKLDIGLLDAVVDCMYTGIGAEQKMAEKILTTLKEHPEAWTRVDTILECSSNQQTKYYALQILENVIKTKWKVLPRLQCEGIKKFIVGLIIKTSSAVSYIDGEKVYLGKLNMILVQILKHEWPKNWPTFIEDIVGSSKSNESLCQNNMVIMKLLSEEVFDFSLGQMTQTKIKHLKDTMCSEFSHVFSLCQYVLSHSDNALLVVSTLETLLKFMHWIPLGYIFETDLIATLTKFLNVPMFRNVTLQCLTEIANVSAPEYQHVFIEMFRNTTSVLKEMLAPTTDIKEAYKHGNDDEQKFIQNLSLFYQSLFMNHLKSIECNESLQPLLNDAYEYLLNISEVKETEIFKICLELWNHIVADLYKLDQEANFNFLAQADNNLRTKFYSPILVRLRKIMISRMARPEEVLVVENEQGEVVREFMKDTDSINLYKNMRECLVYLTHLDYRNTETIMTDKLHRQTDGTEWSWNNLNTLCWAIGSISGAMNEDDERRFLVIVIRDLLGLCEQKRGKDNKAIVASNIMYVVGQYPRFLKAHWRFLKTVITKLFEFMHETHEGVQDMACDTFIKIAHKCRRQFVTMQSGEMYTFVDEILSGINSIISDLSTQQVHTFYEAMAMVVACETDTVIQQELIAKLFYLPNQVWDEIINKAATDSIECLQNVDTCKQLVNILKTNYHGCKSLGSAYVSQLSRIYLDMLNIYKVQSENINVAVCNYGEQVTKQPLIKSMRAIKKETLKIIASWVHKCQDPAMVAESFIAPMLDTILYDYQRNIAPAREPEVLSAIATIINRLHYHINGHLPTILDAVFECTLDMINKNMEEYPEHRTTFFTLLEAVNQKSFMAFASLSPDKFKLVLDSVIWAVKHTMRQVSETGLNILLILLQNVETLMDGDAKQIFYGNFFVDILHHMFSVVTDSSHVSNLTLQCTILSYMFKCLEQPGRITIDLTGAGSTQGSTESNILFVQNSLASLLKQAFPQLQNMQIKLFIEGLFSFNHDLAAFRENMRDFLVQIREFMGDDLSDLYLEEKDIEIKKAQQDKYLVQSAVPGILNPHELADDMVD